MPVKFTRHAEKEYRMVAAEEVTPMPDMNDMFNGQGEEGEEDEHMEEMDEDDTENTKNYIDAPADKKEPPKKK